MSRRKPLYDLGPANGASVGIVMREALRRACIHIDKQRFKAEGVAKGVREDGRPDFFTKADKAAQRAIVKLLRKNFPLFGIVAEENKLSIPCRFRGADYWFTVDPIDGTSAYLRRQSHGIGSQAALIRDGVVIAAYVRDANSGEVYGYRPDARRTWRITSADTTRRLEIDASRPLADQYLLLRDPPDAHGSELVVALSRPGGPFKSYDMADGSIGISMARLWKGEVGAAVLHGRKNTPWDWAPVYGISRRLGFRFFSVIDGEGFVPFDPPIVKVETRVAFPLLVVHESRLDELEAWLARADGPGRTLRRA